MIITDFNKFFEAEKSGKLYKYGVVMLYLDIPNWKNITDKISRDDIYLPNDPTHGTENNPHVTVLYGLHKEVQEKDIREILIKSGIKTINIETDGISIFENDEFDVVKIGVISEELTFLNKEISKLPHTTDYPDYKPHMTISYVNPKCGNKYIDKNLKIKLKSSKIIYKMTNGQRVEFNLNNI